MGDLLATFFGVLDGDFLAFLGPFSHTFAGINYGGFAKLISVFRPVLRLNCEGASRLIDFRDSAFRYFQSVFTKVIDADCCLVRALFRVVDNNVRTFFAVHVGIKPALFRVGTSVFGCANHRVIGVLENMLGSVGGLNCERLGGFIDLGHSPRHGVHYIIRRHRLVEAFLVQVMGMSWAEVHEEAEQLEHAVSDRLIERIDAMLGRPAYDPHGDPIPDPEGVLTPRHLDNLLTCPMGTPLKVTRIADQDPAFLHFIEENDLKPGQPVQVDTRDTAADSVLLRSGDRRLTIGTRAASKLLVEVA